MLLRGDWRPTLDFEARAGAFLDGGSVAQIVIEEPAGVLLVRAAEHAGHAPDVVLVDVEAGRPADAQPGGEDPAAALVVHESAVGLLTLLGGGRVPDVLVVRELVEDEVG